MMQQPVADQGREDGVHGVAQSGPGENGHGVAQLLANVNTASGVSQDVSHLPAPAEVSPILVSPRRILQ